MLLCSFFYVFDIKEEMVKQITGRWEKAKWGLGYRTVNNIMCNLEDGHTLEGYYFRLFKGVST